METEITNNIDWSELVNTRKKITCVYSQNIAAVTRIFGCARDNKTFSYFYNVFYVNWF